MVNLLESINVQTNAPLDSRTVVKALSNRDAISTTVRYLGMKVYVSDEKKEYRLEDGIENSHWKEIKGVTNLSEMVSDNNHMTVSQTEKDKWDGKAEGNHNHDSVYAKTSHKHNASEVTGLPTALKNPTALTIQLNGKNDVVYDGSAVKSVNITPAGIGAQPSGNYAQATHTHVATQVTEDTTHRFVTDTDKSNWNGKAAGNHNHDSVYAKISHKHTEYLSSNGNITVNGNLTVTGEIVANSNITGFSDKRLKTDIKTIENALDKVMMLDGITYKLIGDEKHQAGLIAQDVQKVLPEVVVENSNGILSLDYSRIVALLVNSIKELNYKVGEISCHCHQQDL